MSDHADTIRRRLMHRNGVTDPEGAAALHALVAEVEQLRAEIDIEAQEAEQLRAERDARTADLLAAGKLIKRLETERDAALAELKALRSFASGVEQLSLPGLSSECAALLEQKQQLQARCEQAIDALREIFNSSGPGLPWTEKARAALLSLGETE